ncbi:hypothetical protein JCM24511_05707 [Saitozyma sp. JCM 24511]|nr:hypothetical protein JCM24511_05707 [Saitozyma sp. JCM 24511]
MTSEAGVIIYKAFAPTLKMMLCIGLGFVITKRGLFPASCAKGVSILSLNISLPCLIFYSMVDAFSPSNGAAFGSLVLVALIYQFLGFVFAWVCRELFYVPTDFQWGILVMGTVSNWGNLPTAVVNTIGKSLPFDGTEDITLGTAYIAIFVLVMQTFLFPCGLHKVGDVHMRVRAGVNAHLAQLCALDFKEENLERGPRLPLRQRWAKQVDRVKRMLGGGSKLRDSEKDGEVTSDLAGTPVVESEQDKEGESDHGEQGDEPSDLRRLRSRYTGGAAPTRKTSRASSFHSMLESTRPIPSTAPLDAVDLNAPCGPTSSAAAATGGASLLPVCSNHGQAYSFHQPVTPVPSIHKPPISRRILSIALGFLTPVSMSIILGVVCSVVLPLKALFVPVDGWTGTRIPNAPNDEPPLSFITDTTQFLGGISIPAGLVLLGASFARLKVRRRGCIMLTAAGTSQMERSTPGCDRVIIIPVFGVFFVQALRDHSSLYPTTDKMRTFVAILLSGTPAAVNQLVLTQLYNPEGSADTLAAFLLLQYLAMPVLST